ncbi:MAG: flippase [Candidatus Promineifilaceae bacterium]|jgi:O-antigen/teichoic acid export membrane protein
MPPALRVLKNSTVLSSLVILERGISFFLAWYVARILGREIWGDYSTALSFTTVAVAIAPWGFVMLLPRKISRNPGQTGELLVNSSLIGAVTSILTIGLLAVVVILLDYPAQVESLILLGIFFVVLPQSEASIFEAAITGLEKMEWIFIARFPLTIIRVGGSVLLLMLGFNIGVLFVLLGIYYLSVCLIYIYYFKDSLKQFRPQISRALSALLFRQAIPFVIIVSLTQAFQQTDRIFLSKLFDTETVGIYATGALLIQLLYMIAPAVMTSLFPGLSRAYRGTEEHFSELVSQIFKLLLVGVFPLSIMIIALASFLILTVFGDSYEPSIIILQILAIGILPSFLSRFLYRVLLASDNERRGVHVTLVSNGANLLLNIMLIPRYSLIGASVASVVTILVGLLQNFYYVNKSIHFDYIKALLLPMIGIMLSSLLFLWLMNWNILGAGILSIVFFLAELVITKTITRDDLAAFSFKYQKQ